MVAAYGGGLSEPIKPSSDLSQSRQPGQRETFNAALSLFSVTLFCPPRVSNPFSSLPLSLSRIFPPLFRWSLNKKNPYIPLFFPPLLMRAPRTVGRTITIHEGRVLLLRNQYPDGLFYGFPGGWQEYGEALEECAARETREEAGLDVRILKPLYLHEFISGEKHLVTLYFLAEPASDPGAVTHERDPDRGERKIKGVLWVPLAKLPSLPLRPSELVSLLLADHGEGFRRGLRKVGVTRL